MGKLYQVNGRKVTLNLHPGQTKAWDSQARFVFMLAGSQGGKTSFEPWWLWREIQMCGAGDYLAVTATFDMFKLKFLPEMREVFEHVLGLGRYWAGDKVLELKDPRTGKFSAKRADDPMYARIILRSASAGSGLESSTAKGALLDECGLDDYTFDTWLAVRSRVTLYQGRVLGGTSLYNLGWIKQHIFDRRFEPDSNIEVIQFDSMVNPSFSRDEFEDLQKTVPKWKFDMRWRGQFGRPAGMIYGDFIDAFREQGGHKVKPFKIPKEWVRYVGVDPGAVNTAMIWLAHDINTNRFYLYRESLDGGKSTPEHAKGAAHLAEASGEYVRLWFVGQKAETQQRMDWIAAGVRNVREPSVHDVESGIDRVIELFKRFRLFIFEDCEGVLDELGRYLRVTTPEGEVTEVIKNKEKFHRLDALRYVAIGVTAPAGSGVWV